MYWVKGTSRNFMLYYGDMRVLKICKKNLQGFTKEWMIVLNVESHEFCIAAVQYKYHWELETMLVKLFQFKRLICCALCDSCFVTYFHFCC